MASWQVDEPVGWRIAYYRATVPRADSAAAQHEVVPDKPRKKRGGKRYESRNVRCRGGRRGSAGLSAALILGRSRRWTLALDAGEPRNAPSSGVHGFFSRDGTPPKELLRIAREQLGTYPGVEVRSARAIGARGDDGGFEVDLEDGSSVKARKLLLATGVVDDKELWGRGVYHCPYCHGWEVRDRPLAVLNSDEWAAGQAALIRN